MKLSAGLGLILLLLPCLSVRGQVPNGSFESWDSVWNFETPTGWYSNQDTFFHRIARDTLSVDGEYSAKFKFCGCNYYEGCTNWLLTTALVTPGQQQSLYGFYKLRALSESMPGYLYIVIRKYIKGVFAGLSTEYIYEPTDDFHQFEVPLEDSAIDSIVFWIRSGGVTSPVDGPCLDPSVMWLDKVEVLPSTVSSVDVPSASQVSFYPNPTDGVIHLTGPWTSYDRFTVFSDNGTVLQSGVLTDPLLQLTNPGLNLVVLSNQSTNRQQPVTLKVLMSR